MSKQGLGRLTVAMAGLVLCAMLAGCGGPTADVQRTVAAADYGQVLADAGCDLGWTSKAAKCRFVTCNGHDVTMVETTTNGGDVSVAATRVEGATCGTQTAER